MSFQLDVLQARRRLWIPALVFFLVALALFSYYRLSGKADEVSFLEARLETRQAEHQDLAATVEALEARLNAVRANRDRVQELYSDFLASRRQRLTRVIAEVRTLARQAGMDPSAVSYPEEELEEYDLVETSFVFNVEGTYANLRGLINSLELTDSFLTLESVSLSERGDGGSRLIIRLRISALFADEETRVVQGGESS